ncbi:uncharacterized protein LOC128245871 [Mya arenaria]|uniref:uncharacterized protein LOC128245871 n=1 Tax=Mya arenaria TaxID=6604 RepID=UPI0022E72C04|nr:uncharacterized protein LOC128245871 [Mya arenaria]XP_052820062.1 uncharacterized protein LOC128245871 [Mya arenaria]
MNRRYNRKRSSESIKMNSDLKIVNVTSKLQSVITCLNNEPLIQRQLVGIESKCGNFISAFKAVLRNEGGNLNREKQILLATRSIETLAIEKPLKSLHEIGKATNKLKGQIGDVEVEVGNTLEDCRSRVRTKQNELSSKKNDIEKTKEVISLLENEKKSLERDKDDLLQNANAKEEEARQLRNKAEGNKIVGASAGIAGGLFGVALAPFTAGGSLVALAAGVATMALLLANAADLESDARIKRDLASQKENEAKRVSQTIRDRERDCRNKEQEVRNIENEINRLTNEQRKLSEVSNLLSNFVGSIMRLQLVFQNAEVTFRDTLQQTKVLEVFDKECTKEKELLDMANSLLDKTKDRWNTMENELVQQGLALKAGDSRLTIL